MRLFFALIFLVFSFSLSLAQTKMTQEDYINKYFSLAVEEMNRYKIPASITLAQGLIETESGNSLLATKANNHFGIKCKAEWTGPTFIKDDDTKNECFRAYGAVEESYRDHSLFLLKPRYSKLFSYDMTDYRSWAYGLKEAGYATNPNYPAMLIKYIEELKLFQFDKFGMDKKPEPQIKSTEQAKPNLSEEELIRLRKQLANNIDLVIVNENFDIYKVASMRKLPVNVLMEFNDVEGEQTMRQGQNFFLNKKEKINAKGKHIVLLGESLYDISQMYGVSLKQLRRYNKLESWEQPYVGETIYLSGVREDFMKSRPFYQIEKERIEKNLQLFIPVELTAKSVPPITKIEAPKTIEPVSTSVTAIPPKIIVDAKDSMPTIINNLNDAIKPVEVTSNQSFGSSTPDQTVNPNQRVWINHSVKPKETIFRISKIYYCNPNEILNWNAMSIEQGLKIGQSIRVHTLYPKGLSIDAPESEEIKLIPPADSTKLAPKIPQKPRTIKLKAPPVKPTIDTSRHINDKTTISDENKPIQTIEPATSVPKPPQKPRAVILKAPPVKSVKDSITHNTNEPRTVNGMRVEKISMQELYKNVKRDTARLDTAVRGRIKLSGD
jgi:LysM repeat protein